MLEEGDVVLFKIRPQIHKPHPQAIVTELISRRRMGLVNLDAYRDLDIHMTMLKDRIRIGFYKHSIESNRRLFENKVIFLKFHQIDQ